MEKLTRKDLYTLEDYAQIRAQFRQEIMAHKAKRTIPLGEHIRLFFEDRLTMLYQVQEMLRAEKIFEREGIEEELSVYNPLIPDGTNWKATMMIEYADARKRDEALRQLAGIERQIFAKIEGFEPIAAIADEDLPRSQEDRTSTVHFLRFELGDKALLAVKSGVPFGFVVNHPLYRAEVFPLAEQWASALRQDLD
jgi:hypothetical protein